LKERLDGLIKLVNLFFIIILEGRDKFCKAIQYASRFLKYHYEQQRDFKVSKQFDALFGKFFI